MFHCPSVVTLPETISLLLETSINDDRTLEPDGKNDATVPQL